MKGLKELTKENLRRKTTDNSTHGLQRRIWDIRLMLTHPYIHKMMLIYILLHFLEFTKAF